MSKHTPGPWTIGALESGQSAVDGANGEEVTGFIDPADAALIAAAPDMLAALRRLFKACGHLPIEATPESAEVMMAGLDAVRAIKKATGEDP